MVRVGVTKTWLLLLREETNLAGRHVSKIRPGSAALDRAGKKESVTTLYWAPHPKTGIYVPKGHEHVVDDVPTNSASFQQSYWLRNIDGVEKPDHHLSADHYFSTLD